MTPCEGCPAMLTPIQAYRGNRFCSVRCANQRSRGGTAWGRAREWQCVLALLGDTWWMTLSDLAILRYGDDSEYDVRAVRQSLCRARQQGVALERRDIPSPHIGRRSIRGYRLAKAPAEQIRRSA